MVSFITVDSRWSTVSNLENASEPWYVLSTIRDTSCSHILGGNAEIASVSRVPRAMKNSVRKPGVSVAKGGQLLA